MTVRDLIRLLSEHDQDAEVGVQFDVSDHDTIWSILKSEPLRRASDERGAVVVIVAA
jgi:hypothetical protein